MSKLISESESIINKPWGYELIWAKTPMYIGKLLFIHRLRAVKDARVFEVSTPELDDVIRLKDEYGRIQ
jgi:hypothetical protein